MRKLGNAIMCSRRGRQHFAVTPRSAAVRTYERLIESSNWEARAMMELILTVCAVAHPDVCVDQHMLFDQDSTPRQCMMSAPPYIARWGDQHRQWFIRRWKCQYPKGEKDA
jgi:hypothetical protein